MKPLVAIPRCWKMHVHYLYEICESQRNILYKAVLARIHGFKYHAMTTCHLIWFDASYLNLLGN